MLDSEFFGPSASLAAAMARRRSAGDAVVAPFVTVGDPDVDFTLAALERLHKAGATLCELGVPYSDPIADGPVIQASYTRALAAGVTLDGVFDLVRRASARLDMPLVAMTSYAIVFRRGIERFVDEAVAAGLTGVIVPDLPIEESSQLADASQRAGLALVRLVTPTTPPQRAERIARETTGFLYCVSVAGVTGERSSLPQRLRERIEWLRKRCDVPILVGFGISRPEQVREVAEVADGVIVGSAVVRHLQSDGCGITRESRLETLDRIDRLVSDLVTAATTTRVEPPDAD